MVKNESNLINTLTYKNSAVKTTWYEVEEMPDTLDSQLQAVANGNVSVAIFDGWERLLRYMAALSPETAAFEIRLRYTPESADGNLQRRLSQYLITHSNDTSTEHCISRFVHGCELSNYYRFKKLKPVDTSASFIGHPEQLAATCYIVRRNDFLTPLYTTNDNANIPPLYYKLSPFKPRERNGLPCPGSGFGQRA
jgi:hypothetical protein